MRASIERAIELVGVNSEPKKNEICEGARAHII